MLSLSAINVVSFANNSIFSHIYQISLPLAKCLPYTLFTLEATNALVTNYLDAQPFRSHTQAMCKKM